MSVNYIDKSTGDLIRVAGQGKAEYGASTVRKGRVSTPAISAGGGQSVQVTFTEPMPDNDYEIEYSSNNNPWAGLIFIDEGTKTKNGFNYYIKAPDNESLPAGHLSYTAFKLYTDTEYNNLLNNAVLKSDVTDAVTNGDMNPVTSNAVYDAMNDVKTVRPTPVTGGAAGTVTWDGFDVKKLGKLVNITINGMRHTSDVSVPGVTIIATGLPKPALGRIYIAGINYGDDGNRASAYIDANGNLGLDTGFLLATSTLYGSCSYISV